MMMLLNLVRLMRVMMDTWQHHRKGATGRREVKDARSVLFDRFSEALLPSHSSSEFPHCCDVVHQTLATLVLAKPPPETGIKLIICHPPVR